MTSYVPNSVLFDVETKREKLIDAIMDESCCYGHEIVLWNLTHDIKIHHVGDEFDEIVKERGYTPTQLLEKCRHYDVNDFLFVEIDGEFESFEYLEEQNFFDYNELIDTVIEKNIDGGFDYIRNILNEKEY